MKEILIKFGATGYAVVTDEDGITERFYSNWATVEKVIARLHAKIKVKGEPPAPQPEEPEEIDL